MSYPNLPEIHYQRLVNDISEYFISNNLEECFTRLKNYIGLNFKGADAVAKTDEVIHYQSAKSRIDQSQRQGIIDYATWNQEVNKITKNIQEFLKTLKPKDSGINLDELFENNKSTNGTWNYEENLVLNLVFQEGFGLLEQIFFDFMDYCESTNRIKTDLYFFDGSRKISIDENRLKDLSEEELLSVVKDLSKWSNAVIIYRKDNKGHIAAQSLIIKSNEKEEIKIRSNGRYPEKGEIAIEVVKWFRNTPVYSNAIKEPFNVIIPHSSLSLLDIPKSENTI